MHALVHAAVRCQLPKNVLQAPSFVEKSKRYDYYCWNIRAADLEKAVERLSGADFENSVETDAYATTFLHDGKFVVVDADSERAEQAMKILRDCGATRVNRHG